MSFNSGIIKQKGALLCSLAVTIIVWLITTVAVAQFAPSAPNRTPTLCTIDPCAGTGSAGSSTYNACKLRERTLSQDGVRTPDLSGLDRSKQLSLERKCGSDLVRGQEVYSACLRRELGIQGYDPNTALRPLPDTQRHVAPSPKE